MLEELIKNQNLLIEESSVTSSSLAHFFSSLICNLIFLRDKDKTVIQNKILGFPRD
jgi:hypothetical protein